jgi:protein-disulfide isomerase/uncharacterized membrane protein
MTTEEQTPNTNTSGYKALIALGIANLGWGIFQWVELVSARQGGKPSCSFNETLDCAAVWDGNFASTVHDLTLIPVAGWGSIWALMALLLPIFILKNSSENLKAATRLTALAGLASIPILGGVSFSMGVFCLWCIITYVLVAAYGFIVHSKTEGGLFQDLGKGLSTSVGLLVLGVALAWVPASKTPKNQAKAGLDALKEATQKNNETPSTATPAASAPTAANPDMPDTPPKKVLTKEQKDAQLGSFISQMPPEALQLISNFLAEYNKETKRPIKPVRDFHGAENSPVLITDFTDARCGHCAQFVASLADFEYAAPAEAFRVEARHFPIDGTCNPAIPNKTEDALGCYAAKAQICMEGHPKAFDFTRLIFQNQQQLSKEAIQMIAKELAPGVNLAKCVADAATKTKLDTDIQYALEHDIQGTPMILVNGQKANSFPPFLFSLIMAEGDGKHKAFAGLPAPKKIEAAPHGHEGHDHGDEGHEGHKH